jgi:predicted ATPase
MSSFPKVVLTGGPCAGKTVCLRALADTFGPDIWTVPEAATLLLAEFPRPAAGLSPEWVVAFQEAVLDRQLVLEEGGERQAREQGARLLVCDRGLLDGAAYWPGGRSAFLAHFGLELQACLVRYRKVIHLESLAVAHPEYFGTAGNQLRYEMLEEAREREQAVEAAWQDHPDREKIAGGDLAVKVARVEGAVRRLLEDGGAGDRTAP